MGTISWYALVVFMTLLGSLGGLFFKQSTEKGLKLSRSFITNMMIGGIFYLSSAVFNIIALHHLNYSIVYPMTSVTYIWSLIFSYFILNERITMRKMVGVLLIIVGTFVLIL